MYVSEAHFSFINYVLLDYCGNVNITVVIEIGVTHHFATSEIEISLLLPLIKKKNVGRER